MKRKAWISIPIILLVLIYIGFSTFKRYNFNTSQKIGAPIDSLNHVIVYYNGGVNHVSGRNTTADGYNLGLNYQCVEFVKRYYYQHLKHKMPDSYGNAKDFFLANVKDGELNNQRALHQYRNPSRTKPQMDDLLILKESLTNRYGHVAIVSKVSEHEVEIIQQNPGPFSNSRATFALEKADGRWKIKNERVLGWLRKTNP